MPQDEFEQTISSTIAARERQVRSSDMSPKKTPGSAASPLGTENASAVSDATFHQRGPDIEALWDACRKAQDAAESRKALEVEKLKTAALPLGFTPTENGRWVKECPGCGSNLWLSTAPNGYVRASRSKLECEAVTPLEQWLRDNGFQS
ncbi:hypothetical protein ACVIGA_000787 [Bradyrhizobium sp. USDA 3240]